MTHSYTCEKLEAVKIWSWLGISTPSSFHMHKTIKSMNDVSQQNADAVNNKVRLLSVRLVD